ncbi:Ig-like domain-containing protein [Pyxidicoccus sp. MSG2]|uniref:Ig-like domain-containing protein n=1 Tax=Pyxidicoccus sp. MSG2 TaxID=2996790 RepID=UPI00226F13CC|nr:hypothetical protein [Pyxidicoccus sp. MSG2]MCY1020824.1 hypothetical protein [Pyxidicoccus sp. MSG2]
MLGLKRLSIVTLMFALVAGCSPEAATGSVQFVVSSQEFAANGSSVARIQVTVSGPDFASISQDLVKTSGTWGGTISGIPAGTDRSFLATGFSAQGVRIFEGQATNVTIVAGNTALVAVTLQDLSVPVTPTNDVPIIDSVTVSSNTVEAGGQLTLSATAHDPVVSDTLSYAWTASAGSLSSASTANTVWTAPSTAQTVTLTLTVRDVRGGVSTARVSVEVVAATPVGGSATIQVSFNTPPIVSVTATEGRVRLGQDTTLSANVVDVDFEPVTYQWTATCAGTFSTPNSQGSRFTPSALPSGSCNNCSVTMTAKDGHGGQNAATLNLCVVPADSYAP